MNPILEESIEFLRNHMEQLADQNGDLLHKDVIAVSQLLDQLIVEAQNEKQRVNWLEIAL